MSAPIRVLIFEDLQCPDCADFYRMLNERLLPVYREVAAFEHHDFPLPKHSWAKQAAIAARYFRSVSDELELAWRSWCLSHLKTITPENFDANLARFAAAAGSGPIPGGSAAFAEAVESDIALGTRLGIAKTPTVLVGDRRFIETFPLEDLTAAIDSLR